MDVLKLRLRRLLKLAKKRWYVILVLLLTIIAAGYFWLRPSSQVADISLSEIRKQTAAHKVTAAEVKYHDRKVIVTLTSGKRFESSYPNEYDDDLVNMFEKNNVPVKATDQSRLSKIWEFSRFFVFMAVIYAVLGLIGRRKKRKSVKEVIKPPSTTFADVGANEEVITELREVLDGIKNPQAYRDAGLTVPKGILLHGPPGTGKTLLARAVAGEARLPFFATSGSSLDDKYAGGSAEKVRNLYERAKKASIEAGTPAIVFVDEVDAIAPKRSDRDDSVTRDDVKTLNQLLELIDGFEKDDDTSKEGVVVTIAATNRRNVLDDAILRRLTIQILVPLPNQNGRRQILGLCLRKFKDVDLTDQQLDDLAKLTGGMSGSGLADLVNEAGRERFHTNNTEGKDDLWPHFEEALLKIRFGPKREFPGTDDQHVRAAVRAAGQAVASLALVNIPDPLIVTGEIRGETQGAAVLPDKPDDHPRHAKEIRDLIVFHLAGRAAEQIVFSQVTSASRKDVETATALAIKLVCEFSWSTIIPRVINPDEWKHDPQASDLVGEANMILEQTANQATKILLKNRDLVESIAALLQERHNSAIAPAELKKLSLEIDPTNFVEITRSGFSA